MTDTGFRDHVLIVGPRTARPFVWALQQRARVPYADWALRMVDHGYYCRAAGLPLWPGYSLRAPFRCPHHTVREQAVTGVMRKGWQLRPGELSLAHGGVFFVDEAYEWHPSVLDRVLDAARTGVVVPEGNVQGGICPAVPAEFRLIVHTAACPCGNRGTGQGCSVLCSSMNVRGRYDRFLEKLRRVLREVPFAEWSEAAEKGVET